MKIYTKRGDKGFTSLFDSSQVKKNHPLISFYGSLDDLNSSLGIALVHISSSNSLEVLTKQVSLIQKHLFEIAADSVSSSSYFQSSSTESLENWIDTFEKELPTLKNFILPSGTLAASSLHQSRCKCRYAERLYCDLEDSKTIEVQPSVQCYLNRLSDYLFVAARQSNFKLNCPENSVVFKKIH
ncbi:Cob(I)yrinic acid a,c-diamide adenosyltransferase [Chlamydiales bacterium SCGC AB-751-O23]|jgi:cob(I)alamin adenosyltransferase|nr:Cob(I)yrinic acid a,c-diamide adenosyltransferase [Chlamydiales bacterium SCGC AB-751-O23]